MVDAPGGRRTITVAALQPACVVGDVDGNLDRAGVLLERAAAQGAQMAVLPEAFATGYLASRDAWDIAVPADGTVGAWTADTARRLGLVLGCGFIERAGPDCFSSCAWSGPDGRLLGIARKTQAEAYPFCRGRGVHVIDSSYGRIGVGICADNRTTSLLRHFADNDVDLVAMPHAAPVLAAPSRWADQADVAAQRRRLTGLPVIYAEALGVPVVLADQTGAVPPMPGLLGRMMRTMDFHLPGLSRIVDSDSRVVAELGPEPGAAVADVVLDPARKR